MGPEIDLIPVECWLDCFHLIFCIHNRRHCHFRHLRYLLLHHTRHRQNLIHHNPLLQPSQNRILWYLLYLLFLFPV